MIHGFAAQMRIEERSTAKPSALRVRRHTSLAAAYNPLFSIFCEDNSSAHLPIDLPNFHWCPHVAHEWREWGNSSFRKYVCEFIGFCVFDGNTKECCNFLRKMYYLGFDGIWKHKKTRVLTSRHIGFISICG
jgi:hypothetical protein